MSSTSPALQEKKKCTEHLVGVLLSETKNGLQQKSSLLAAEVPTKYGQPYSPAEWHLATNNEPVEPWSIQKKKHSFQKDQF